MCGRARGGLEKNDSRGGAGGVGRVALGPGPTRHTATDTPDQRFVSRAYCPPVLLSNAIQRSESALNHKLFSICLFNCLEDLGTDMRIMLKWNSNKYVLRVWIKFNWLRIVSNGGIL
jgi:hypothetical protein